MADNQAAGQDQASAPLPAPPRISSRPRITLDIDPLLETHWTGIPVFTRRLIQALTADGRADLSFSYRLTSIPHTNVLAAIRQGGGALLRQQYENQSHSDYRPIDLGAPILYPSVKQSPGAAKQEASMVHDISTLTMPDNHEDANIAHHLDHLARELATDDVTFCASEATKAAVETYFPSAASKTQILYQYVDWPEQFPLLDKNLPRIGIGRYAVVIGTVEPRKNLALLLRALTMPELQKSSLKFVIIGKPGWLLGRFLEDLTPAQRERLIFSGFVSEFVKYRLIKAAEFMVYPSLYEGFGIPALEALSLGKPVLAARTSSFPEVIGPAGIYFDPLSPTDFIDGLKEIENPARLKELSSLAIQQAGNFTPTQMAAPVWAWLSR